MKEYGRGIGAVMMAMGGIAIFVWLAVARLSPNSALSMVGVSIAFLSISIVLLGAWFLKRFKG